LKRAGLVEERVHGRFRYYRLRPEPLTEVDAWIGRYRAYLERCLDALGEVLDTMPDEIDAADAAPANPKRRRPRPRPSFERAP
jgi:hypothetical protein